MHSKMAMLVKSRALAKTLNPAKTYLKSITTFTFLSQEPQLADPPTPTPPSQSTSLPPNPATGSPLYIEKWRNPVAISQPLAPIGFPNNSARSMPQVLNALCLMNLFADFVTSQSWNEIKQIFESWIRSLDQNGKPNKPDVNLYNHYLRAKLSLGASAIELLYSVAEMENFAIEPNTASFNLVLKSMYQAKETVAATTLLELMELKKESQPDDESFDLVIGMLFLKGETNEAFKYVDLSLKSGFVLSTRVFTDKGKLDTLVSIIEKCKVMDQYKALCPTWLLCNYIAEVATQHINSKLAFFALEFMARWIFKGENTRPPIFLQLMKD